MVGLGDTKKKIQKMIDAAEDLYGKMNQLRAEVDQLRQTVESTSETVDGMEHELAEQRALLDALAADADIDTERVLAEATIATAEDPDENPATGGETSGAAGGAAAEPED
ncbi:DUF5798 family protein [Halorientalis litorea]|jgi:uncharacterized protein YlxW (UPF0749 family)|uniref:DUF5798 family protein n=1 Tax=Halorientalis litorea TaxID=2931977 RepID=UPI001FF556FB|nr:DUF5798 family protein [Halorientalis litorea]